MTTIGKYNTGRSAVVGPDEVPRCVAAATGGRRFWTARIWQAAAYSGPEGPYTGRREIALVAVDHHPCWIVISDSESAALCEGEAELKDLALDLATCPQCAAGTHPPGREVTVYPERDEAHGAFRARVRALLER